MPSAEPPSESEESVREQLERAVRDLWSMLQEAGDTYVVFLDHRGLRTRVEREESGSYRVSWETDGGEWLDQDREYENPREAAFHAYQGPH